MSTIVDPLTDLLKPDRLTCVVDIGANPIDGDPPYKTMLKKRLCRVVGFEPQEQALAALKSRKSDLETYLPYAIGDGTEGKLHICRADAFSSLFAPDEDVLRHFAVFSEFATVEKILPLKTHRLDDVEEIDAIDLLKIDAQGSELSVFTHGKSRLAGAVAIQTEVSFLPLYRGQPVFGEVDLALRTLGFIPHAFAAIHKRMIAPMLGKDASAALNQLLEADVVYIRDFMHPDKMDSEQLKQLALIAHHCYGSYDLATNCIFHLWRRGAVSREAATEYGKIMRTQQEANLEMPTNVGRRR